MEQENEKNKVSIKKVVSEKTLKGEKERKMKIKIFKGEKKMNMKNQWLQWR